MAIKFKSNRQCTIAAVVPFSPTDLVTTVPSPAVELPANARILSAAIKVDTAFNVPADAVVLQTSEAVPVVLVTTTGAAGNAVVSTAAAALHVKRNAPFSLNVKWTGTSVTGAATVIVEYVVDGRAEFSQG